MRANRKTGTRPERALRSALHAAGLRFRVDLPVPVADRRPVRVDVAFPAARLAVLVDGCFWHACPAHGTQPAANTSYWAPKLARNVTRDREVDAALAAAGWTVVRVWEHERSLDAAARVAELYCSLRAAGGGSGKASSDPRPSPTGA